LRRNTAATNCHYLSLTSRACAAQRRLPAQKIHVGAPIFARRRNTVGTQLAVAAGDSGGGAVHLFYLPSLGPAPALMCAGVRARVHASSHASACARRINLLCIQTTACASADDGAYRVARVRRTGARISPRRSRGARRRRAAVRHAARGEERHRRRTPDVQACVRACAAAAPRCGPFGGVGRCWSGAHACGRFY
jgi:hypothetical protein